jgi:ribosomal protein S18 acetylase RimI-like enzyme
VERSGPVRLADIHNRTSFDCGNDTLNNYLKLRANQDARRGVAYTYVLADTQSNVVAYFTLSSYALDLGELPERLRKQLPQHGMLPATLIGRLAVSKEYQGQGIGSILLAAAAQMTFLANPAASIALVVDAIDAAAVKFYRAHGFVLLPDSENRLFMARGSLAKYIK